LVTLGDFESTPNLNLDSSSLRRYLKVRNIKAKPQGFHSETDVPHHLPKVWAIGSRVEIPSSLAFMPS
jgi:hypothetical protein